MLVRFLADEDFDGRVLVAFGDLAKEYELEIDVVRVQDVGLIGADDPSILEWAAANRRVVLTHDRRTNTEHATLGRTEHVGEAMLVTMEFTEEMIRRISEVATPENLQLASPGALEEGRQIANAYFDTYTDEEWRSFLNKLYPDQAAGVISHRPPKDRQSLLMLIHPDRRTEVERFLASLAA